MTLCTSNHMFGRTIWNKLLKYVFENFESAQVKREQFQNFQKSRGLYVPKIVRTKMWLLVNHTKPTNTLY